MSIIDFYPFYYNLSIFISIKVTIRFMNYLSVTIDKLKAKQNVFLTGGAGVGKTTIPREVIKV